jgi:hypothetical protein
MTPEEKQLFAAYLNMARQNAFITLSHISKLIGGGIGSEENLAQMPPVNLLTRTNALPENVERVIKLLNEHFPFLKPMLDKEHQLIKERGAPVPIIATPQMYSDILKRVFNELNSQRNQCTHLYHEPKSFDKELISYMKTCFDGAVRVTKERFSLQDTDVNHLKRFREKPEAVHNKNRRKKYEENPDFYYKFDDHNGKITIKGLAFFTCLFLERKYANLLLSKLKGFKRNGEKGEEESTRATKTVFSIYNIRIPKLRIDSENSAMTLGIDMLNELKKCPAELFEHLKPKDQERFRVIPDEMPSNDNARKDLILLRRFENRFPQLALGYIDRQELFSNVRFQVALGVYRYKFYDKQGVDQRKRIRILQKKLHGFGRLQEIEKLREQKWAALIRPFEKTEKDQADTKPYITDMHAQYMISNNRVGMYWNTDRQNKNDDCLPALNEHGAKNQPPVCWLSIYELPAMIFHSLLCSRQNATQNIIRDYAIRYRKVFTAIHNGELPPSSDVTQIKEKIKKEYKIDFSRLPDEIRDYLSGKEKNMECRFAELAETRIRRMIKDTQGRRHKIETKVATIQDSKKNKIGKKRYEEIKSGVLADFLAEDLMQFQPTQTEGKDKLTGVNYQALQATLAYFGRYKDEMKQIFTVSGLLDSPIAHPFLDKVMLKTHNDIVGFYQSYLNEREIYLNKCLNEKKYKHYHFLRASRDKWRQRNEEYYKQLAKKYLALPIELPRGLFNEAIHDQLNTYPKMREALSQKHCNTVFLIQTYFANILEDDKQEFYDFPRSYKLFDTLDDKIICNKLQQAFHTTAEFEERCKNIDVKIDAYIEDQYQKERKCLERKRLFRDLKKLEEEKDTNTTQTRNKLIHLRNEFEQNEKILRLTRVQDMLLFLMAKKLLIDNQLIGIDRATIEEYKLKDIKPDNERDILSVQTSFSLLVTQPDGSSWTIRQEQLKLKNFGDFYRLIHDRRVETLLPHLLNNVIDRLTLKEELDGYDEVRVEVFGLIHLFERFVIEKKGIQKPSHDFVEILKQCPEIDHTTKQQMQIIRNAFSHNCYPKKEEEIRDVESDNARVKVAFDLDGAMPNVARMLMKRLKKMVEDSLIRIK